MTYDARCKATSGYIGVRLFWLFLAASLRLVVDGGVPGSSNIAPDHALAWGANIGWTTWQPSPETGARINPFFVSGWLYSANLGWIHLGNGQPANRSQYQNDSATDFGVNVRGNGQLRGFAYGANIGWIRFGEEGSPQVDLATGHLSGFAYCANVGWISLASPRSYISIQAFASAPDTDGDGLPDAWELEYATNLAMLSRDGDFDHDGATDLEEYLAGTDPTNAKDYLRFKKVSFSPDLEILTLTWSSKPGRAYQIQTKADLTSSGDWINDLTMPLVATADSLALSITNQAPAPHAFFRVEVVPSF